MSTPQDDQPRVPNPQRDDLPPEFQTDLTLPPDYFETPTRRRRANRPPAGEDDAYADYGEEGGPGCIIWTAVMLMAMFLAVAVVILAGTAGYTEGKRIADESLAATQNALADGQLPAIQTNVADLNAVQLSTRVAILATRTPGVALVPELQITATHVSINATATQQGQIDEQLTRIPDAVLRGDRVQVEQRLAYLATQTPGVPQVPEFAVTATALAQSPLGVTTESPIAPTDIALTPTPTPTAGDRSLDPNVLLQQAQDQISYGQLEEATRTLDLIMRLDPSFQTDFVQSLMFDTLVQQATVAYRVSLVDPSQTGTLAEAVRLTDQAELYGSVTQLDLAYERSVAEAYLNAIAAIEANDHITAIRRLEAILQLQTTNYKGVSINDLIFDEYVAYGDAYLNYDRDGCAASQWYAQALSLYNDATVAGKKASADTLCQQGNAQPTQGTYLPGETPVSPIGVPGT